MCSEHTVSPGLYAHKIHFCELFAVYVINIHYYHIVALANQSILHVYVAHNIHPHSIETFVNLPNLLALQVVLINERRRVVARMVIVLVLLNHEILSVYKY